MTSLHLGTGRLHVWFVRLRHFQGLRLRRNIYSYGVQLGRFQITNSGIWFPRRGDEVLLRWPWLAGSPRPDRYRWVSLLCEGGFKSLASLDCFWLEYERACRNTEEPS